MGEGMACGGLPFPGTGCPIPDVDYLCLLCIDFYVWDAVSTFNHLPRMFLSTDFAFWITDWTCCHGPYLHAILRIITGDPLHSRALAHSRAPLFTQPCPHCSHSRAPGEQWARLCVFTLQGCVQAARLCRGSPVIISRGVSGLATDSPCGVWGRGWTTCLLHDSPLFGSHFKMRVGM